MAKKTDKALLEVDSHYQQWTKDNEIRASRRNGWNDVTDAYYGKLPDDWPYTTMIVDPRLRTSLLEKNARLINTRLRGRLVPREGGDDAKAAINNAILDFQWETANDGGSMQIKLSVCDMDARLYQSKFGLVSWKHDVDEDGNVLFDGNEFYPLDIRDCGMDPTATHIRNAKWFQWREWAKLEDLENQQNARGDPIFKNLDKIRIEIANKLSNPKATRRDTEYTPRVLQLRGLEDHTGEDYSFPVVKLVHEYRKDRWITYAPDFGLILRDIENPYNHKKIPIAQLRYYPIQDDPLGESEAEPVLDLWRAIQATLCAYMDEVTLNIRPPIKIIEGQARVETIEYGPGSQWLMNRQDAVMPFVSGQQTINYFQSTYSALVSAFNTAMGDLSQGVSAYDIFSKENKTATEIRATQNQQNVRDQKNQNDLAEFIEDIMMMWLSNNKQFLFSDARKGEYILRIVGKDMYQKFEEMGFDESEVPPAVLNVIRDTVMANPNMKDYEVQALLESSKVPKYPVFLNPEEKDPAKFIYKAKMIKSEQGDSAELSVIPEDLDGTYDYVPDIKSMSAGSSEILAQATNQAISLLTTNQVVLQLLQSEGYRPNMRELARVALERLGLSDGDRFFEKINAQQVQPQGTNAQMGSLGPNSQIGGLPNVSQANSPSSISEQLAGSPTIQNGVGIPQGL